MLQYYRMSHLDANHYSTNTILNIYLVYCVPCKILLIIPLNLYQPKKIIKILFILDHVYKVIKRFGFNFV